MTREKTIKTSAATISLIEDNIILNRIDDNANIETHNLLEQKETNYRLNGFKPYAVLVDPGNYSTITKEARELSASKKFGENTIAKALIAKELPHLMIAQFYIKINKPFVKTKIFRDHEKAIQWLKKMVKEYYKEKK